MKISIIIPAFNEEKTILSVIERVKSIDMEKEIIVVDDGSSDGTRRILSELKDSRSSERDGSDGKTPQSDRSFVNNSVSIIFHDMNQGKGQAIRTGLESALGELVAIQDADLEYDPSEILKLIKAFNERPDIDAVFGSRFLMDNPRLYKRFLWGNKFLTSLTNLLYGSHYTDTYTCYKVIKRSIFKSLKLESKRFEIEAEICCKLAKGKIRVVEVPIRYQPRTLEEGKKINGKDALKGVMAIFKYL